MFKPVKYNLPAVLTGCTYTYTVTVLEQGILKIMTDCVPYFYLFKKGELLINDATSCARTGTNSTINIEMTPEITSSLPLGNLNYRIEIKEVDGEINRYMEGIMEVKD